MQENKKILIAIFVIVLTIFLISGGTLAYWQWMTSADQNTLVNASPIDDASMYIEFPNQELHDLYPTSNCNLSATSSWVSEVTVDNRTGVMLAANFKLKIKITDNEGNVITNSKNDDNEHEYRYYIKYVVTEENGDCNQPLASGNFNSAEVTFENAQVGDENYGWYDSNTITESDTKGFPNTSGKIGEGVSFNAPPNKTTKHRYKIWVWLDNEYTSKNYGNAISDPLQNAKISVSWSENSNLEQVRLDEAYAVYSATDHSLRFYRSKTPIVKGQYNGIAATEVYTGFESASYKTPGSAPWYEYYNEITSIVFEDYIYPLSTANWFWELYVVSYVDIKKLDTSNVTDMKYMFGMFGLDGNGIIDLSHFDTSNVKNMDSMFTFTNYNERIVGIENWDTSNVTSMNGMFYNDSIEYYYNKDLSVWNVCKVTDYDGFYSESAVTKPFFGDPTRCNGGNPDFNN